jgi:hypothetical protein
MPRLSFVALGRFYLPLALSGLLMTLQQPVVAAAISRSTGAKESLAAYGLALSVAVLLESPIQMLLATGAALARDRASFWLVQRFTAVSGAVLVALGALLAFTPLGQGLFLSVLKAPPSIASQALLALRILLLWPLVVAWRRFYQGVLISRGQTRAVGYGTAGRLVVITIAAFLMVYLAGWPGTVVGTGALLVGALAEALFVTGWLWLMGDKSDDLPTRLEPLTLSEMGRFYWPLALTSMLMMLSWPLTNAGLGRAAAPIQSLAVWPVALSILWLFTTPLQMLQQMTIALVIDLSSLRSVRWFALELGGAASGLLVLLAFTPLLEILLLRVLAAPADVTGFVILAVRLLTLLPFLTAVQGFYQGLLISQKRTGAVRTAMGVNLLILIGVLVAGIRQGTVPGSSLAASAMAAGLLAEVGLLWWQVSRLNPPWVAYASKPATH